MGMKAPSSKVKSIQSDKELQAEELARKMYETESEVLENLVPWGRLSEEKRQARITATLAHMNFPDIERINSLERQVREQRGDYLTALSDLADDARAEL